MCLQAQGIGDNDDGVGGGRRARGLSKDDKGVGRGRGIYDASEGSDTTKEAAKIQGQRQRLRHRDVGPEELATMMEALAE